MDLLGAASLPFLTRRNYYYEFKQIIPWSVLAGVVEGQFASVVVSKSFHGSPLLIAIATATPVAAFISSLVWGMLCVGRPKIRLLTFFTAGTALCAGIAGAVPTSGVGAVWFIAQVAAAQVLAAGVVTVRSAVWRSNYPREVRGRITAGLQRVRFIVSVLTVLLAAAICDRDPMSYRYIFPVAAAVGLVAAWMTRRLHIRGERSMLERHGQPLPDGDLRRGLAEPFSLTTLISPGHVLGQMVRVLRNDRRFMLYCVAQFFVGVANLMTISIVAVAITRDLPFGETWGFWVSTALLVALPQLVVLGSLERWGRLFDRLGVLRFRVINVALWTVSILMGMLATLVAVGLDELNPIYFPVAVGLFVLRSIFYGLGRAGGALAWHLGHLHFARPEEAEIYMGIHVSFTGFRGLVAPLGGIWLWQTIGWPVWLIALTFSLVSLALYGAMARQEGRTGEPDSL